MSSNATPIPADAHNNQSDTETSEPLILFSTNSASIWGWLFVRGLVGASFTCLNFFTMGLIPVGDSITVVSIYPIGTAFLAWIVFREPIRVMHGIAMILCIGGIILISSPEFIFGASGASNSAREEEKNYHSYGYILGLTGSLLGASCFIVVRKCAHYPYLWLVHAQGISGCLLGLIIALAFQDGLSELSHQWKRWFDIGMIGIFAFCGQLSFNRSAQLISPGLSSMLRASDIIETYLWQIIFFGETPSAFTFVGALLILIAISLVSYEKIKRGGLTEGSAVKKLTMEQYISDQNSFLSF